MGIIKGLLCFLGLHVLFISCSDKNKIDQISPNSKILGTWVLVSNTVSKGDSLVVKDLKGKKLIKIINKSHFAFFNHDVINNVESKPKIEPVFVSGAGTYTFDGKNYHEHLEYCNYRAWENRDFYFKLTFNGDTLIQEGLEEIKELGISQRIEEKYLPFKEL